MKYLRLLLLLCLPLIGEAQVIDKDALNTFIDNWHKAAAEADEDVFFGSMAEDGIYIGTDASERWVKPEFEKWSMAFFKRESAWAFTPYDRTLYFSEDGQYAWFEESLKTWMGICRGSGVLHKSTEGWKIKHYHLSVTVPNELIKDFISLVSKGEVKE